MFALVDRFDIIKLIVTVGVHLHKLHKYILTVHWTRPYICPHDMTFEPNNDDNKCHFEGYQAFTKRPQWRKVGKFTKIYKG